MKCLPSTLKALALISSITQNQVCWCMPEILALESWRWEVSEIANLRPVWNTRDSISKTKLKRKEYMAHMKMLKNILFGD